jgi:hypothetical protein
VKAAAKTLAPASSSVWRNLQGTILGRKAGYLPTGQNSVHRRSQGVETLVRGRNATTAECLQLCRFSDAGTSGPLQKQKFHALQAELGPVGNQEETYPVGPGHNDPGRRFHALQVGLGPVGN